MLDVFCLFNQNLIAFRIDQIRIDQIRIDQNQDRLELGSTRTQRSLNFHIVTCFTFHLKWIRQEKRRNDKNECELDQIVIENYIFLNQLFNQPALFTLHTSSKMIKRILNVFLLFVSDLIKSELFDISCFFLRPRIFFQFCPFRVNPTVLETDKTFKNFKNIILRFSFTII